jgi:hypothetical protein
MSCQRWSIVALFSMKLTCISSVVVLATDNLQGHVCSLVAYMSSPECSACVPPTSTHVLPDSGVVLFTANAAAAASIS